MRASDFVTDLRCKARESKDFDIKERQRKDPHWQLPTDAAVGDLYRQCWRRAFWALG
jgi:hypothetical protein